LAHSDIPLYLKIYYQLREEIESGKYKAGELLPSEEELAVTFQASRTTIRNALQELEKDNLIFRKRGKGTVV